MSKLRSMVSGTLAAEMQTAHMEERLVLEAQAYSDRAWALIFDQHYPKMLNYCYLRTGNRTIAEDLASEVFLEALRGIRRYRYRGVPFSAWLYRIAHNLTVDYLRRNARQPAASLDETDEHLGLPSNDETGQANLRQDLLAALRKLTADQQQVILLRFFHDLSHEETAAIMGRHPGAVRVLQSRALSSLRRVMAA